MLPCLLPLLPPQLQHTLGISKIHLWFSDHERCIIHHFLILASWLQSVPDGDPGFKAIVPAHGPVVTPWMCSDSCCKGRKTQMEATTFRMYNGQERSWVLPTMQASALLSIYKNPEKPAGTTVGAPHGLTKIRKVANLRCYLLLSLLLAMIQMELKCYRFGSALNSHHCCPSFPIQLTSSFLRHLFSLCFYPLIVFHIPSIYKLFSPFTLCIHSSAEMNRDMTV